MHRKRFSYKPLSALASNPLGTFIDANYFAISKSHLVQLSPRKDMPLASCPQLTLTAPLK